MPRRHSWHSSPPLLNPPLLIILFPIVILTLLFLAVRPLLSAATSNLRPASSDVKTSWDSLNILLVVFAILCGVFARRNNDDEQTPNNHVHQHDDDAVSDRNTSFRRVQSEGQSQWFGFAEERKVYGNDTPLNQLQSPGTGGNRLRMRRNSSSYPDLRQWETGDDRYKFRFYDDFEIDKPFRSPAREYFSAVEHRKRWPESPPSPQPQQHQHQYQQQEEPQEDQVKEIPVDTFEIRPSPPSVKSTSPTPPPPPPPPPPESARRNTRRRHRKVERERESEITVELDDHEFTTIRSTPPVPPTPPHPPSVKIRSVRKSDRKKSTVKREMAMIWASVLSNQRKKKKKQKTKNNENHDQHYNDNVDELTNNTTVPPPPPPPPPPPSVFHSLFRKGLGKSKKIHSVSAPPPPPPPPPSKRKSQIPPPPEPPRRRNSGRPPLHNRTVTFNDETLNAGNQSPLTPVPPPPPPPPFKMKAMKFVVRGDFVKIRSNQSSRCSSPEREDIINASESTINNDAVTDAVNDTVNDTLMDRNVFCPSPDVNVKAATFIARLRGEWRLEKLNSLKEKGNGSLPCSL